MYVWVSPRQDLDAERSTCKLVLVLPLLEQCTDSAASLSLSLWYPRYMLQTRIAIFSAGVTFAGAFSGLLAFAISYMSGTGGLLGWSWIFVSASRARIELSVAVFNLRVTDTGRSIHCYHRYHRALW